MSYDQKESQVKFFSNNEDYFEFSNYYLSPMNVDGIIYHSNEHYFQSQKFNYNNSDK